MIDHRFDALVVVSPAGTGDERKDQDRAIWFGDAGIAALCDGLTSSPYATQAAEAATQHCQRLFYGSLADGLRVLADELVDRRTKAPAPSLPADASDIMRDRLREQAQQRMQRAFQTTLVASRMAISDSDVEVDGVRVGDSSFFAFASDGEVLGMSPEPLRRDDAPLLGLSGRVKVRPGDQLLVDVLGCASELPLLVPLAESDPAKLDRWLVCFVAECGVSNGDDGRSCCEGGAVWHLAPGDVLLVPKYLVGKHKSKRSAVGLPLRLNRRMRTVAPQSASGCRSSFAPAGSVTAALPEAVAAGEWTTFRCRVPHDSHIVLASDGFTSCFSDPASLWGWLSDNNDRLRDPATRAEALQGLHERLELTHGDDDVSFVWIFPLESVSQTSAASGSRRGDGGRRHAC